MQKPNKTLFHFFLVLLLTGVFISCEKKDDNEIRKITFGQLQNHCLGYCSEQIEITSEGITYIKEAPNDNSLPPQTCSDTLAKGEWDLPVSKIDVEAFKNLPDTTALYPEGEDPEVSAWVEIETQKTNKVVFPKGQEPSETKDYIDKLRKYLNSFEGCASNF